LPVVLWTNCRRKAGRVQAELAAAERDWKEWVIAGSRVGEVLAPPGTRPKSEQVQAERTALAEGPMEEALSVPRAAKPKSQVPARREGCTCGCCRRTISASCGCSRLRQWPLMCQEKVEALRSKAKRLVARGG
jgi:hypothetical protein